MYPLTSFVCALGVIYSTVQPLSCEFSELMCLAARFSAQSSTATWVSGAFAACVCPFIWPCFKVRLSLELWEPCFQEPPNGHPAWHWKPYGYHMIKAPREQCQVEYISLALCLPPCLSLSLSLSLAACPVSSPQGIYCNILQYSVIYYNIL